MSCRTRAIAFAAVTGLTLGMSPALDGQARPAAAPWSPSGPGTRWVVDIVHSQVEFRVRHLVGRVRGTFSNWYSVIVTPADRDWRHGSVTVTVQTASLNTGNAYRDADLRSPRFFATDSFPQMAFEGNAMVAPDSSVSLSGMLSIKGHHRPVTLNGRYYGLARDPEGYERIAFEVSTVVDRRDYGMEWNQILGANTLVGNEVEITVTLEAIRATP